MLAIVTGMIATYPVGGAAWDYGHYLLGFERLGFDVVYLEDTGLEAYNPDAGDYGSDFQYGVEFLRSSLAMISPAIGNRWHVRGLNGASYGLDVEHIADIAKEADLFLNVSGSCLLRDDYLASRRKVLIDTDPGLNHFVNYPRWDANPGWQGSHGFRAHDFFFTYAERIGQPDCSLPGLGLSWLPTRPPVVLDRWHAEPPGDSWTTVMTWNNFQRPIAYEGRIYGAKELEFDAFESLPSRVDSRLEIAVGGATAPRDRWRRAGWSVVEGESVSRTAEAYRSYVQQSRGEFSVAKNTYVATHAGWFSCRSVCYLAAGRPVVLQDTGFSASLPVGEGLLAFSTLEEAELAIATVEADYVRHAVAAREVAKTAFASERVLGDLLAQIGL